jgi:hypothetical protein
MACNKPEPEPTPEPDTYPGGVIATLDIRKSDLYDEHGHVIEGTEYAEVHSHDGSVDYSTMTWRDYQYFNIVIIPDTYEGVPVTKIEEDAFKNYTNHFWYVNMPDSIEEIGDYAFYWCFDLETVNLPKYGVTLPKNLKRIGHSAFESCNFKGYDIIIPDKVEIIEPLAFNGCGIKSVVIPKSVQYLGYSAFGKSEDLIIYYEGTEEEWNALYNYSKEKDEYWERYIPYWIGENIIFNYGE